MTNQETYPLAMFSDSNIIVITRGRTIEEAFLHASKTWGRGQTITIHNSLPLKIGGIPTPEYYGLNHAPGWLYRKPVYLGGDIE